MATENVVTGICDICMHRMVFEGSIWCTNTKRYLSLKNYWDSGKFHPLLNNEDFEEKRIRNGRNSKSAIETQFLHRPVPKKSCKYLKMDDKNENSN